MLGAAPATFMSALFAPAMEGGPHGTFYPELNRVYAVRHPVQHPVDEEKLSAVFTQIWRSGTFPFGMIVRPVSCIGIACHCSKVRSAFFSASCLMMEERDES